ncbi:MAG: TonB-dependent receptor domain-containing protein [Aeromonas sp.]
MKFRPYLAALLLPAAAHAELLSIPVEPTIATVSRMAQSLDSVLMPVTVIERAEIAARQVQNVPDLLRSLPGVQWSPAGGRGHVGSLFIRGTTTNQTLILIDGRPLAAAITGSVDISQIPLANIERVEYIRGPRAAVYGSDAIGGVINVITQGASQGQALGAQHQLALGVGSFGQMQGQFSGQHVLSPATRINFSAGYEKTDGFDIRGQDGYNPLQPDNDGFAGYNLSAGVTQQINSQWQIALNGMQQSNQIEIDGYEDWASGFIIDKNSVDSQQFDLGLKFTGDMLRSELSASYGENELKSWSNLQGEHAATITHTGIKQLAWINHLQLAKQANLIAGIDWKEEGLKADSDYLAPDRNNQGVFALASYQWSDWLFETSVRSDDNEQYGLHTTWSAASGVQLNSQHRARLSYATAFRAPTFSDLYYPGSENPKLKPEMAENLELGLSGHYPNLDWSLDLYRNDLTDMIAFGDDFRSYNINQARLLGAEVGVNFKAGLLTHHLSYDFTRAQDRSANKKQLDRVAKHKGSWRGEFNFRGFTNNVEVLYVGERTDLGSQPLPSYTLLNIATRYDVTPVLSVGGRIDNLLDRDYEAVYGFAAPGVTAQVNAQYRF